MGYNTYYNIEVENIPAESVQPLVTRLEPMLEDTHAIFNTIFGSYYGRWYDWDKDLLAISSDYPDVFITVHGDGEDSEDLWRAYIKDGAIQECGAKIVYDEYDPAKMREVNPPHLQKLPSVEDLI